MGPLPSLVLSAALLATPVLSSSATAPPAGGRIVLVVLDDVGIDRIGAYGEHPAPGRTPNLDRVAERGLLFRNAYSNPFCSPTRAQLLTGRASFRTGVGGTVRQPGLMGFQIGLDPDEQSLPDALGPSWSSLCIGKWHLADAEQSTAHPQQLGFAHHAGSLYNLGASTSSSGSYYDWWKTIDGVGHHSTRYATIDTASDAVRVLQESDPRTFLWLAFNAAHSPAHRPPDELHAFNLQGDPQDTPVVHTKAMIEALDMVLGRVIDVLEPSDYLFVISDNGTDRLATSLPFPPDHGKGTLYEGGVNVPLLIMGPGVRCGEVKALVSATDIFATICELAGQPSTAEDSISLLPYFEDPDHPSLRRWVYSEHFRPNGPGPYNKWSQAIRGERYKLMRSHDEPDQLFDLEVDPFEQVNLLAAEVVDRPASVAYGQLLGWLPVNLSAP